MKNKSKNLYRLIITNITMGTTIESLHEDILGLKEDIAFIKNILTEDLRLSFHAKKGLKKARETPESEYTEL